MIIISSMLKIRVPATSANLGPGFDCLGLALDLWNEITFEPAGDTTYQVTGEGAHTLNVRPRNLLTGAMESLYDLCGQTMPGIRVTAHNQVPLSSGLGSSAAAILAGLSGANELLDRPLGPGDLLKLATEIEGHPDNVAAALLGGLVVSTVANGEIITRRYVIPEWTAIVVKPDVDWPTSVARSVLPALVPRADAIFNLGRTALVVEALRSGDLDLLQKVMEDRLHQSYRLERIPAGPVAYQAARAFGAAALSGAGPSIIIFVQPGRAEAVQSAVTAVFSQAGIPSRALILHSSNRGVYTLE
jgi:homoserine kinase